MSSPKLKESPQPEAVTQAQPRFEDMVDMLAWLENATPEERLAYLNTLEEVPEADFKTETRRLRAEWAAMPREEKQRHRVGEAVRERLLILGMRQAELARRLEKERSWVTRLVQGRENVTLGTLSQLAEVLECDERDLVRPIVDKAESAASHGFVRLELPSSQRTIAPTPALSRRLPGLLRLSPDWMEADKSYVGAAFRGAVNAFTLDDLAVGS